MVFGYAKPRREDSGIQFRFRYRSWFGKPTLLVLLVWEIPAFLFE